MRNDANVTVRRAEREYAQLPIACILEMDDVTADALTKLLDQEITGADRVEALYPLLIEMKRYNENER